MDDWSAFEKLKWGLVDIPVCFILGTIVWSLISGGSIVRDLLHSLAYLAICYLVYLFYRFYIKKNFGELKPADSKNKSNPENS